jgi:GNAT superfamily N-acetyltransferase
MNQIQYGSLHREDVPSLLRLYKQLNPKDEEISPATVERVWESIENTNIHHYGGKNCGEVVACCYICIISNLTRGGKSIGFIENVITAENFRRQGLARKVLGLAIDYAKSQNCYKVVLQSGTKRKAAHHLYESLGFDDKTKQAFELRL